METKETKGLLIVYGNLILSNLQEDLILSILFIVLAVFGVAYLIKINLE